MVKEIRFIRVSVRFITANVEQPAANQLIVSERAHHQCALVLEHSIWMEDGLIPSS